MEILRLHQPPESWHKETKNRRRRALTLHVGVHVMTAATQRSPLSGRTFSARFTSLHQQPLTCCPLPFDPPSEQLGSSTCTAEADVGRGLVCWSCERSRKLRWREMNVVALLGSDVVLAEWNRKMKNIHNMLWVKEVRVSVDYRQQSWRLSSFKFSLEGDVLISASSLLTLVDVSNSRHVFSLLICEVVSFFLFFFHPLNRRSARQPSTCQTGMSCFQWRSRFIRPPLACRIREQERHVSDTSKQSENASIGFCWIFFLVSLKPVGVGEQTD